VIFSPACVELTKRFEGCKLTAYPDPGTGGAPWTIGWGHTFGVRAGMKVDQQQADMWLMEDLTNAAEVVALWVKSSLTQPQFDSLVDFVFNVGPGLVGHRDGFVWLKGGGHSTLLRMLNSGYYDLAAEQFLRWNQPPLAGILSRRHAERDLFLSGTKVQA
jgi:lysozyme